MDLRQLRYFSHIAELEHFGRAADRLHIAQPALTRQIRQLEEEIGVELFERLPRGVRLTAAGRVLFAQTKDLLAQCERMIKLTQQVSRGQAGLLRIGFADGVTFNRTFSEILKAFRQECPDVVLDLVPASSLEQAELLARKELDLGFVYWLPKAQSVHSLQFQEEALMLAVPKSSHLAKRKSITIEDLSEYPIVWFRRSNSPSYYDLIVSRFEQKGCTLNVVQEANNESTMLSLVSADIGATFITESALRRKPDDVVFIPVTDLNAMLSVKAMWSDDNNPALSKLVAVVRRAIM
ncbi:MAG: LysR family transcriptional regulator [Cyanobacteria bacterium SZAS-4]|nr:LysR family transcriptional regulator [Cyanobacteria bacterium SZAS-4]